MQSEADFRKAIENSPTAWVTDSSGNTRTLTGKEVRESNLNSVINANQAVPVYWTDEGWSTSIKDPYIRAAKEIQSAMAAQAPKIKVENNKVKLRGTEEVLASPLASQIREQMKSLAGSDPNSSEFQEAVDALNKEVENSLTDWMMEQSFGWTPEEFNDYQYAIQTVNVPNPMQSSNKLKAKRPGADFYTDENGVVMEKTPQEWIDYWRDIYNTDQRTDMFRKSLESDDPYERVMALVMSQGGENPIYGYDTGERIGQNLAAFKNQMKKFPYGIFRLVATSNDVKRVEDFEKKLNLPMDAFVNLGMPDTEEKFEQMKKDIEGKKWGDLTDVQKAFLVELGVSKEDSNVRSVERGMLGDDRYRAKDLENMSSENDYLSKEAIGHILVNNSYDEYKKISDDYNKMQASDAKNIGEEEERLAKNAIWSQTEQNIGNFAGVIGRFFWENAVGKALTGKSMGGISDEVGAKIVTGLGKLGISPTSKLGTGTMQFLANLAGTVPEDLVQTSVDNIVTYNADENANLFNPEQMSDNLKMNLLFMSLFNAGKAGLTSVKKAKILKQLSKQAELDTKVDIGAIGEDAFDAARVYDEGGHVETDGTKSYKVNADGTREELKNTTPEQANIIIKNIDGIIL